MDKIIEALNEVVLSNQKRTAAIENEIEQIKEDVKATKDLAKEAKRQADASWELVTITRNQVTEELQYLKKPFWKRWFGM